MEELRTSPPPPKCNQEPSDPFLSSLPLGTYSLHTPEPQKGSVLPSTVYRSPLLFREPRAAFKDGYWFDSETASPSLCLSVFGTEENGHQEPTGVFHPAFSEFYVLLSANSEAEENSSQVPAEGGAQGGRMKTEKGWEEGRPGQKVTFNSLSLRTWLSTTHSPRRS